MLQDRDSRRSREDGFTLVELLIVIGILGILTLIAVPIFLNQQEKATTAAAKTSLATAYRTAKAIWKSDDDKLPSTAAALASRLATAQPQLNAVNSSSYTADQVSVELIDANTVTFRTLADSGESLAWKAVYGANNSNHRVISEGPLVTRTNLATNPIASAGVLTKDWTNAAFETFQAVELGESGFPAPPEELAALGITTAFNCIETGTSANPSARYVVGSVTSGTSYRFAVYVWRNPSTPLNVGTRLRVHDTATATTKVVSSGIGMTKVGEWERIEVGLTADSTESYTFRIEQESTGVSNFLFTAVLIEQSTALGPYVDGNFPGGIWSGTAYDSISTAPAWESW